MLILTFISLVEVRRYLEKLSREKKKKKEREREQVSFSTESATH